MADNRVIIDCRKFPSDNNCQLTISGREQEVLDCATAHAASKHGHKDTPELRTQLKSMLVREP